MKIWQGACIVHATFPARRLAEAQAGASGAPRWWRIRNAREAVLAMADFIGSTSAIIDWCAASDAAEFIVMTESGVNYSLQKRRARQAVLLRGQRELQLQRVPVHEAEYAGKAARLPAQPGAARRTVRRHHARAPWCRSSACSR